MSRKRIAAGFRDLFERKKEPTILLASLATRAGKNVKVPGNGGEISKNFPPIHFNTNIVLYVHGRGGGIVHCFHQVLEKYRFVVQKCYPVILTIRCKQ